MAIATRAILVGIDTYARIGKTVPGPCAGAIAMAKWLLSLRDPQMHIDLFLAATDKHAKDIANLKANSVVKVHGADSYTLSNFLVEDLAAECIPASRLFIYWSSHGFTSSRSDHRYFYCSDYSENLQNAFNASNYLRQLRTDAFRHFDNQIFLADVCGLYRQPKRESTEDHVQRANHQLAYFATVVGEYAETGSNGGDFTLRTLKVLEKLGSAWSDHDVLSEGISQAFSALANRPFELSGWRDQREIPFAGQRHAADIKGYERDALELLIRHDVVPAMYKPHYQRTVACLGLQESAPTLPDVLHELASMRDGELSGGVPHGLLQFMMRLGQMPALADAVEQWLAEHAAEQMNSRSDIADRLALESRQKILLIEVQHNMFGTDVASFRPHLCRNDGSYVEGSAFSTCPVMGWDEMVARLPDLFAQFAPGGTFSNLELHFAVDPPLFDRPFHMIPIAKGGFPIGGLAVVVVRHRQRMRSEDDALKQKWNDYVSALRAVRPSQLKWERIDRAPATLPSKECIFFAGFSLPPPADGVPGCEQRKMDLQPLLLLGAPCIYLPHAEPKCANWKSVRTGLNKWLKALPNLDAVTRRFLDGRVRREALALDATLLWDDPQCNPFVPNRGVSDS